MKKKDRQERELKENTITFPVLKNWLILVQAAESPGPTMTPKDAASDSKQQFNLL